MMRITGVLLAGFVALTLAAQDGMFSDARQLVQRVQSDLAHVRHHGARNDKEHDRIEAAQKHLSDFDRNLSRNKFEKDRLDEAIDDVKNIVDNNTLQGEDRDALNSDLGDLRHLREMRGNM